MPQRKRKRTTSLSHKQKIKNAIYKRNKHKHNVKNVSHEEQCDEILPTDSDAHPPLIIPNLCESIDRKTSMKEALKYMNRTKIENTKDKHRACICTICDSFIIGVEPVCWLSREEIQIKRHYLSVSFLEDMIQEQLPEELRNYYKIEEDEELHDLLLSPRAQTRNGMFMSCQRCNTNIKNKNVKTRGVWGLCG